MRTATARPGSVATYTPRLTWQDRAWLAGLVALAVALALLVAALFQRPDGLLHFWALDVGQGDALLLQTPQGQDVLIDGGPDPAVLERQLSSHLPFWQRDLGLMVLTHPHEDHITGLIDALSHYRVARVLETPYDQGVASLEDAWRGGLALGHVPVTTATIGQVVTVEPGLTLQVLYPPPHLLSGTNSDINNSSVVMRLGYGAIHILLTGDVETDAVHDLLAREGDQLAADVIKVPHHGSATGLSADLLAAVHPRLAVISVGLHNPYGHPAPSTIKLLHDANIPTYRTDLQGTVEVLTDGRQIWVHADH
jgi:competence protein ComEC